MAHYKLVPVVLTAELEGWRAGLACSVQQVGLDEVSNGWCCSLFH